MRFVALLDTSIASNNLGDEIIIEAVRKELAHTLPDAYIASVPSHDYLGRMSRKIMRRCDFAILGGTNAMSSQLLRGANWKLTPLDALSDPDVVLMGVGWQDYHANVSTYARALYGRVLSKRYVHSFRDGYSLGRSERLALNALNTACPTMWRLDQAHCRTIPTTKASQAVVALTYYRPEPELDRKLIELVCSRYDKVHFWSQQFEDWDYLRTLGDFPVELVDPNVAAFTALLDHPDIDYVGSRLHGGIRALQRGRRALIVVVDNRAAEIGRDTGCQIVQRSDLAAVADWIERSPAVDIRLPMAAIETWRAQFAPR